MRLKRPRRHVMAAHRVARPAAGAINENWSMDFVSDALYDGRRIRALTVVDDYSRESLAIEVGQSIAGEQVVAVMNRLTARRGAPQRIRVDNGPEFVSRALDQWAYLHQVTGHSLNNQLLAQVVLVMPLRVIGVAGDDLETEPLIEERRLEAVSVQHDLVTYTLGSTHRQLVCSGCSTITSPLKDVAPRRAELRSRSSCSAS
jgi:Integrase core domain